MNQNMEVNQGEQVVEPSLSLEEAADIKQQSMATMEADVEEALSAESLEEIKQLFVASMNAMDSNLRLVKDLYGKKSTMDVFKSKRAVRIAREAAGTLYKLSEVLKRAGYMSPENAEALQANLINILETL